MGNLGTVVTCPFHGATFDLTTGSATGPPASSGVKFYQARTEGDEIQISAA
jgi:3-phenylpropionate/trans-cinnamate dioxygenase ferredoxin subunit/naphthalene 1,2-dioxygenase system ferredoxin subunit